MSGHTHGRIIDAARYDGSFDLDFLRAGESVRAATDGSDDAVIQFGGGWEVQVAIGEWVVRHACGLVAVCGWDAVVQLHAMSGDDR